MALAIAAGFVFALFLQAMRVRFFWWPFHPLAFAVSGSWEMNLLWMPLLIAWVFKVLLLRYGGIKTYQQALPFFYGLILGQFIPGSLLNIWGIVSHNPTYQFWQRVQSRDEHLQHKGEQDRKDEHKVRPYGVKLTPHCRARFVGRDL